MTLTPRRQGSVLIIDDEAGDPRVAANFAGMEGYERGVALPTAKKGLARIGERAFDLVLLDLALPDRNGMDLLAEIARCRIRNSPSS